MHMRYREMRLLRASGSLGQQLTVNAKQNHRTLINYHLLAYKPGLLVTEDEGNYHSTSCRSE